LPFGRAQLRQVATFDEFKTLINSGKIIIIDFTATWCGPCQRIGPKFEEFAKQYGSDDLVFVKVDVDENSEAAEHCNVSAMPTFKAMKDGKVIEEMCGADAEKLLNLIKKHAGAKPGDLDF
jgi:thioredoxin 1